MVEHQPSKRRTYSASNAESSTCESHVGDTRNIASNPTHGDTPEERLRRLNALWVSLPEHAKATILSIVEANVGER